MELGRAGRVLYLICHQHRKQPYKDYLAVQSIHAPPLPYRLLQEPEYTSYRPKEA